MTLLVFAHRLLNQRLFGLGLIIFGNQRAAVSLYFVLLFPGILLHEVSHWAVARILGVPTGRIELGPRTRSGRLELGSTTTVATDPLRESLIGLAPLLVGVLAILVTVRSGWGIATSAEQGAVSTLFFTLLQTFDQASRLEFWLGFYIIFGVSNTMLPSPSDRRAWLPVALFLGLVFLLVYLAGFTPQIPPEISTLVSAAMRQLGLVLSITLLADGLALGVILVLEKVASTLTGRRPIY